MGEAARIAIVDAGRVGSTLAYSLAASGAAEEIVLVDANRDHAEGEAMDIAHAVPFYRPVEIIVGEIQDVAGAAITVICAGVAQREGKTRPALLKRNVDVLRDMVPVIVRANPEGLLLMTTTNVA